MENMSANRPAVLASVWTWYNELFDRLKGQQAVEDLCYEFRKEPTQWNPYLWIMHAYPLLWTWVWRDWEKMYILWKKGYRNLGERRKEPVLRNISFEEDASCLIECVETFQEVLEEVLPDMLVAAVEEEREIAEWMCAFLERLADILPEECMAEDSRLLLVIRGRICDMQEGLAYSDRQEAFLEGLRVKLPGWYRAIMAGQEFWFDILSIENRRMTFGIPSFPLIEQQLRFCPGPGGVLEDLDRAIRLTIEEWAVPENRAEARESLACKEEWTALLHRMGKFYRERCAENDCTYILRRYLESKLKECGELAKRHSRHLRRYSEELARVLLEEIHALEQAEG